MDMMDYAQFKMVENIKSGVLRKFPLLGTTMSKLEFVADTNINTAKTDGEKVFWSPTFFGNLSFDEKVFVFAHEIMHVAFNHILRSDGREHKIWNKATDSVINQMLFNEGLPKIKNIIDIPEAKDKSSEFMYDKLLKEYEQKKKNKMDPNSGEPNDENDYENDSHDMWADAVKRAKRVENSSPKNESSKDKDDTEKSEEGDNEENDEKPSGNDASENDGIKSKQQKENEQSNNVVYENEREFANFNKKLKDQMGKEIRDKLKREMKQTKDKSNVGYKSTFENVGESKPVISWKKILRRELEIEEDRWSYRRADEDNDFQARIGSFDVEDYPETEVMLDVSGSVDNNFLRGFLRQLKPLLKESKLRVGCFDNYVYDFVDIKCNDDIDHFSVTRKAPHTENWDLAVKSFSKKREVNKIVFTDGIPCPGTMPTEETKNINVIWLVFKNKNFNPCCGKVIFIDKNQLNEFTNLENEISM